MLTALFYMWDRSRVRLAVLRWCVQAIDALCNLLSHEAWKEADAAARQARRDRKAAVERSARGKL